MITREFKPHPDLLALPLDERMEWAGYLETRKQVHGSNWMTDSSGDTCFCCITALADGRGFGNPQDLCDDGIFDGQSTRMLGKQVSDIGFAANDFDENISAVGLNDDYKLTFPEISELLKGNTVIKEYADES